MKRKRSFLFALAASIGALPSVTQAVEHGGFIVTQLNTGNDNLTSATASISLAVKPGSTANFNYVENANRGDYDSIYSADRASDPLNGILISCVSQNSRNNVSGGGVDGISYGTSAVEYGAAGFYIPVSAADGSAEAGGGEFNMNVAAAYFPHSEGWLAGHATNHSTGNGLALTDMISSPGVNLGYEFIDTSAAGISTVNLTKLHTRGVAATADNGVLLVTGGKNEDNYAMSRPNADGSFTLSIKDNGATSALGYEQDGVAFVYIPLAAVGQSQVVAVGRILSGGASQIASGDFTITKQGVGEWLLKIPGMNDQSGTLIVSPEGGYPVSTVEPLPSNVNNFASYEWDDALGGWLIQSRDVPTATLEDGLTDDEAMFSFAFFSTEAATPAPDISLTSPINGAVVNVGESIAFAATVSADTTKVDFYLNGLLIGSDDSAPFEINHTVNQVGDLMVEAVATSSDGAMGDAARVSIYSEPRTPMATGSAVAIFDGGDADADLETPSLSPNWQILKSTPSPLDFSNPGTVSGFPAVRINGASVAYNSGLMLGANYGGENFTDPENRGAADNIVAPYNDGGNYSVAVMDNAGPAAEVLATQPESSSFSLAYFPYSEGWIGGNIDAGGQVIAGSSNLPDGVTITNPSAGVYYIDGLPDGGNMIATTIGSASNNFASIGRSGRTWIVRSYDSSQNLENDAFAFLYVPNTVQHMFSGSVAADGTLEALNPELAAVGATIVAGSDGYEITFGDGTSINPSNYALLVTSDFNKGNGGDNVYAYSAKGNAFVVFSQDLPNLSGKNQLSSGFRFLATPLSPTGVEESEVVIASTKPLVTEGDEDHALTFELTRFGDVSSPLTVGFTTSGEATRGSDYSVSGSTVTFEAGSNTATLTLNVLEDVIYETDESVVVTLTEGSGYSLGSSYSATAAIRNIASLIKTTTVSFQEGVDGYTGEFDKRIGSDGTNELGTAVASYYLDGFPGHASSPDINGIIRFDNLIGTGEGQIPPGATVVKAELMLTTAGGANSMSGGPYVIDRLIDPVTAETTYDDLSAGAGFEGARGAGAGFLVSAYGSMTINTVEVADITSIVREWATGADNYGVGIFTGGTSDGWEYCTVGNTNPVLRPKLVVSYVMEETKSYTFNADVSALLTGQADTQDGSTLAFGFLDLVGGATQEALLHFPVEFGDLEGQIPADEEIVKAELVLTTVTPGPSEEGEGSANSRSPGPIAVHRMLVDWDVTSTFGADGPVVDQDITSAISRATGLGESSAATFDVTLPVQSWRGGEPNYGLNIKPETTDGWQMYMPGTMATTLAPVLRVITAKVDTTTPDPSAFEQWAANNGLSGASVTSDSDSDGITDLLEYALGLDPMVASSLPQPVMAGDSMSLTFIKGAEAAADAKLTYELQSSSDLTNWTTATATVNDTTEISIDITPDQAKSFFRLNVIYTE
ncbi:DNRLRE domain-containing protein [Luteolibacter pohnpeiensis]|uniref:DNRLRE domain-containing protein n=1 Tax=Luteolibacter pohnpeiensis TaxID=454153 RepID=A0A934VU67_9BACT|nr:DNRLRE domain-containing protein [Luteolibacter pohnpeiensis]MBK1882202.1 DNRLRE domain-containing protein [Luteolibacter pohnpeiensis]